jgi:hypothetical protein
MTERSIADRAKETLKWIQATQTANGLGMVEFTKVSDQGALRFLLRKGDVFEPQEGMVKSTEEPEAEGSEFAKFPDHKPWVWKTPKPKKKGDLPEPYEFLGYPDWDAIPSAVAEALRNRGFAADPYLFEGFSYRKMAGGALRRKMIGTHSKEELLSALQHREEKSEDYWKEFEMELDGRVDEYRGKYKEFPEVEICPGILYYPKDGSFKLKED